MRILNFVILFYSIQDLILHPAPMGALTQLYAGTSKEGATFNGKVSLRCLTSVMVP